ncbi:rab3 GTPase-activating protein catalytic subunit isoform X3 [Wolffia australiana]
MDPSSSSSSSLVSRAKTAIHTAAAKAEKVLADIRIDLIPDRERGVDGQHRNSGEIAGGDLLARFDESREQTKIAEQDTKSLNWKSFNLGKRQDWHSSLMSLRIGKKDPENTDLALPGNASPTHAVPHIDEEDSKTKVIIPSASGHTKFFPKSPSIPPAHALQNLGAAILKAKNFKSVTDCLSLEEDAPPLREKLGLSFQAVKILVVREKDKLNHEMSGKSEISSAVQVLFNPVEQPFKGKEMFVLQSSLLGSIHGAPPGSFLAKVSEITGSFKSLHKMALFWRSVVSELKRLWSMDKPIPHMPLDEAPDLDCCLLHQQLQLINCCITRKLRRTSTSELLDLNVGMIQDNNEVGSLERITRNLIFVKDKSGAHVPRVGASAPSKNLTMIETGEQIYSPYVQEGPVFTEELIKENEEFIMRTGSIGPGCSQLLSDMQAFKEICGVSCGIQLNRYLLQNKHLSLMKTLLLRASYLPWNLSPRQTFLSSCFSQC